MPNDIRMILSLCILFAISTGVLGELESRDKRVLGVSKVGADSIDLRDQLRLDINKLKASDGERRAKVITCADRSNLRH